MMASKEGGIVRGGEETSHANNGVKYIVKSTGKLVELEGDEIVLCQDAMDSKKIHKFNDTPLNILKSIADEYGCKRGSLDNIYGGEFVICKKVVRDNTPVEVSGTPAEVVSKLQADKGCNVHWSFDIEKQDGESCNVCEHEEAEKKKKEMADGGDIKSFEERFDITQPKTTGDVESNIAIILSQYANRKMGSIQVRSYISAIDKQLAKEFLHEKKINDFAGLEQYSIAAQAKAREGKGKERQESKAAWEEQRGKENTDDIVQLALKQGAEYDKRVDDYVKAQAQENKMEEGGAVRVNKKKMLSSAFKIAAKLMADAHFKKIDLEFTGQPLLVHAEVEGNGALKGKRFSHAWVEDDDLVYDFSSGKSLILPKYQYYQIASVKTDDAKKYKRYTYDEVAEKILTTGEYCWDLETLFEDGGEVLTFYQPDMFIPDMEWDGTLQNPPYEVFKNGGTLDAQLEFVKLSDKIFAVKSNGQEILAKTFIRFNSYLDSSKFKGKIFTLKEFSDWYASERGGKFTYYTDFKGFNVPDTVFKVFFDGSFDPLSVEEKWLLDKVKQANVTTPYYVIGYVDAASESTTKTHELAHAFYYLYPEYKEDANAVIAKLEIELAGTKQLADVKVFLMTHKYNQSMWADELQAYLISDKAYMTAHKAWSEELEVYSERLKTVFSKYRGGIGKMEQGGAVQSAPVTEWQLRMTKAQELAAELRSTYKGRLHINSDASITLYHLTGKQPAEKIKERGFNAGAYFFASKTSKYNGDTLMNYKDKHDEYVIMEVHVNPFDVSFSTGTGEFYAQESLVKDADTGMYSVPEVKPKKFGEAELKMKNGGAVDAPKLKQMVFNLLPRNYQVGIVIRAYEVNEDVSWSITKGVNEIDWIADTETVDTLIADYANEYPDRVFAYGMLPTKYLIEKVEQSEVVQDYAGGWNGYHEAYASTNDAKHMDASIPLLIDDNNDELIEDGWHRFHRYIDMGLKEIPVVSYNQEIKFEVGGSVDGEFSLKTSVVPPYFYDYLNMGGDKLVSYMPIETIKKYAGNTAVEDIEKWAEANGYKTKLFPEKECNISSGSLYMWNEQGLSTALNKNSTILLNAGIPLSGDEYVWYIAKNNVFQDKHPEAYVFIGKTFNDKRFRQSPEKLAAGGGINGLNGSNTDEFEAAFTDFELEGDLIINKDPQPDGFSGDSWEQGGTVFEKGGFIPPKPPTKKELEQRWDKKKDHIMQIAGSMRKLRYNTTSDLKSANDKDKLTALVVAVMDKTSERVGNEDSEEEGHYGVSGLLKKHIKINGNTVNLHYIGKSGVEQEKSFTDENIAKALGDAIANSPDSSVFTTKDGFKIKNDRINRYLSKYDITAKDLRGYGSNRLLVEKLKTFTPEKDEADREKQFRVAVKYAAERVGHGAATLKKHYMLPELEKKFIKYGKILDLSDFYKTGGLVKMGKGGEIAIEEYDEETALPNSKDYYGNAGAGVFIISANTGRGLLLKRGKDCREAGTWAQIGGRIEAGEDAAAAAKREVKEEINYSIKTPLHLAFIYRDGDFAYYNYIAVVANEFKPDLNYENVDYQWIELDKLPDPIHFGITELYANVDIHDEVAKASKLFKRRAKKFEDGGNVPSLGVEVIDGFYSSIEKKILDAPQSSYPVKKWKELIGTSNDEAVFTGIIDFIGLDNKKSMTRSELLDFIRTHRIKIEEVVKGESIIPLDQLPSEAQTLLAKAKYIEDVDSGTLEKLGYKLALNPTNGTILGVTQAEVKGLKLKLFQLSGEKESYKEILLTTPDFSDTSKSLLHYDERNVIAHMRVNIRIDSRGARTLFVEEFQSDIGGIVRRDKTKPELPFTSKTYMWLKLLMKYAIRHCISENCVAVCWTTGEQQSERYDLNKEVQELYYDIMDDGVYLTGVRNGYEILDKKVKFENLSSLVGDEVAEMIMQNKGVKPSVSKYSDYTGFISVEELKVNNTGLIDFYGSTTAGTYGIVGDVAVALLKGMGDAKELTTFEINLGAARQPIVWSSDGKGNYIEHNGFIISNSNDKKYPFKLITPYGGTLGVFETLDGAKMRVEMDLNTYVDAVGGWAKQYGFYVSENIKERIYKGIPLYEAGGKVDVDDEEAGYKAVAGKDAAGRDIPIWDDAVVYHTTDAKGLEDIRVNGYRLLGKEQGGYYGRAISFTPDLEYTKQFGGNKSITTKAKVRSGVKILNVNVEADFQKLREITGGKPDMNLNEHMTAAGYDGLYDAGAGDLFIFNPKVVTYIGVEQGSKLVDVKKTLEREAKELINGDYALLYSATSPANWKKILKSGKLKEGTVFFTNEEEARAYGREAAPQGKELLNFSLIYMPSLVYDNGRYLNYEDLYYVNSKYSPKVMKMADGGSFEKYKDVYAGDGSFNRPYDLRMEFPELLHTRNPNPDEKKRFEKWLAGNKDKYITLYHGSPHDRKESILKKGLMPTSETRRNSLQSASGYVYLSLFPRMAKQFADFASHEDNGKFNDVWELAIPIRNLLPDRDQLRNQRVFADREVDDTLADSFIYGHGARIRGKADRNLMKLANRDDVSYFNLGGAVGMEAISCDDCEWTWQAKEDASDKHICGNCGHDNTPVFEYGGDIPIDKWEMPSVDILNYAEQIKSKYPEVWNMGGNEYSNTAYELLKYVIKRGHWIDDEEDLYKKWQSFKAHHAHDFNLFGVIANLKWLAWMEKGEIYSKSVITKAIGQKYSVVMERGGHIHGDRTMNSDGGYDYATDADLRIVKEADIITLPKGIAGTNCGNCLFQNNNFCDHKKILLPVTSRMCCAFWTGKSVVSAITNVLDADFFADKEKSTANLNDTGGYNYVGVELKRAEKADLITLPKNIVGTNCGGGNCMYSEKGLFCNHPKIQLPVTDRMSCGWWNNADVVRKWGKEIEIKFEEGGGINAQYESIIHSDAFKKWFGDWERAYKKAKLDFNHLAWKDVSKIVDKSGKPLIVYHGSSKEFSKFSKSHQIAGHHGKGFYFADKNYAENYYGKQFKTYFLRVMNLFDLYKEYTVEQIKKIFANEYSLIERLVADELEYSINGKIGGYLFYSAAGNDRLVKAGYDGLKQDYVYVVFEPNQIKIADGSNVTFDAENPDIRFEKGGDINEAILRQLLIEGKTEYQIDGILFPNKKSHASRKQQLRNAVYIMANKLLWEGIVTEQAKRYAVYNLVFSPKASQRSVLEELNDGAFEIYIGRGIATQEQVNAILAKYDIAPLKLEGGGAIPKDAGLVFATTDEIKFEQNMAYWNGIIKKFKLPFTLKKYLGSGADGYAYETTKGTVVKISENEEEAFIALLIKSEGKNLQAQASVYNVYKILDRNKSVFLIEKEKTDVLLAQVEKGGDEFVNAVKKILKNVRQLMAKSVSESDMIERYRKSKVEFYGNMPARFSQEKFENLLRAYIDFWKRLKKDKAYLGAGFDDSNISNIGYVDGKLYCFDCVADEREMANGGDVHIDQNVRPTLHIGDMDGLDDGAVKIGEMRAADSEIIVLEKNKEGEIFAVNQDNEVVGFAMKLSDDETDLSVVAEYQQKGIGTELLKEFYKYNPAYPTGGLTPLGRKTYIKATILEKGGEVDGYSKWKRANVTYRGMREAGQPNSTASGVLGKGLYTAPSSNKSMAKEYGVVYFMINARPKNPKKFDSINRWEIWFQNNLLMKYAVDGFPDLREFNKHTTIEKEMLALGYDGIEIEGREIVNFTPENVRHFKDEQDVRHYYETQVNPVIK